MKGVFNGRPVKAIYSSKVLGKLILHSCTQSSIDWLSEIVLSTTLSLFVVELLQLQRFIYIKAGSLYTSKLLRKKYIYIYIWKKKHNNNKNKC